MPSSSLLRSPLSRLLAAVLAFLASPLIISARLIDSSTGLLAAKRFDPVGTGGTSFQCPTYGENAAQPSTLEGTTADGDTTFCEYPIED